MDSPESYVSTRRVGRAVVSQINDGRGGWTPKLSAPEAEWRAALPGADERGYIENEHYTGVIQIGDARILIDVGFDDPSPASHFMPPRYRRTPGVTAGLAKLGLQPSDITHVIFTHHHGDHVAGAMVGDTARFSNARHFIGRADWDANPVRDDPNSIEALNLGGLDRLGLLHLPDGDIEIIPGVTMTRAPGKSLGHSIIRVADGGAVAYFVGDLFHFPCEAEHLDWVSPGRDPVKARRSRKCLLGATAGCKCEFGLVMLLPP